MYKKLSTISHLTQEEIFGQGIDYEYLDLQRSIKNLVIYINSKEFNKGVNSQLEPYVKDLKAILVKLNSTVFNNQSEFCRYAIKDIFKKKSEFIYVSKTLARELQYKIFVILETLNEVVKLFSEAFKITYKIQQVYKVSQYIVSLMIKKAPKSAGTALRKFTQSRGKVINLITPFYIAKEALFISRNNLYNIGKELEYAKVDGNQTAIAMINNKIDEAEQEKSQLDNIKAAVYKISEEYRILISEAQNITNTIGEKISGLSSEIYKVEEAIVKNSRLQRKINALI
jgi:hypothetical protein